MTDIWLTPPQFVRALGPFDLDPCAAPAPRPWPTAARHYDATRGEDGLALPWFGFVWLNPPYSDVERWVRRLADHGHGISLTFARTSAPWFHRQVFGRASGLFFIEHHVYFHHADGRRAAGNGGAPSVLSAFGEEAMVRLARCVTGGRLVVLAPIVLGSPGATWREAVAEAIGGRSQAQLREIYLAAESTAKVRAAKAAGHNWRAQVRRALQRHFQPLGKAVWAAA